jgi:hypothetical protein
MLETRCSKPHTNPAFAAATHLVAAVFTLITRLYELMNKENRPVHTKWMAACAVTAVLAMLKVTLVYHLIIASAFVFHYLIYYAAVLLALAGVGLSVAGAVFFEKPAAKASAGFSASEFTSVKDTYESTTDADTFNKSD